jgi:hypothetical protein
VWTQAWIRMRLRGLRQGALRGHRRLRIRTLYLQLSRRLRLQRPLRREIVGEEP